MLKPLRATTLQDFHLDARRSECPAVGRRAATSRKEIFHESAGFCPGALCCTAMSRLTPTGKATSRGTHWRNVYFNALVLGGQTAARNCARASRRRYHSDFGLGGPCGGRLRACSAYSFWVASSIRRGSANHAVGTANAQAFPALLVEP